MKLISKLFAVVFTLFFLQASLYAQKKVKLRESEMFLQTKTGKLGGTLLMPKSKEAVPVVLIIPGSGPNDRDGNQVMMTNNSLKFLAEGISQNGIATFRVDKRGVRGSADAFIPNRDIRFEHFIDDAVGWIKLLKSKGFSQVFVLGHSQGSLVGMIAARKAEADGFISVCGLASAVDVAFKEQLKNLETDLKMEAYAIIDSLKQGKMVENVSEMIYTSFSPDIQPFIINWMSYTPAVEIQNLKGLKMPVMIAQGTRDLQVQEQEAYALSKAYPNAKLDIIQNMNHVLKEVGADLASNNMAYMNPNLPVVPRLIDEIAVFVKNWEDYAIK